ncbi:hypothetical protein PBOI14_50220 [Pseudomonas sp. Boi14]|nr:hypothetical protein PBOI14_50220 [Pseudomonas sp. Boi14]
MHTLKVSSQTNSILEPRKKPGQNRWQNFKNLMGMEMHASAIESIETIIVDLPTIRPHKLAMHTMQNQTLVLIRLRCADGIEGLGNPPPSVAWPMAMKARTASRPISTVSSRRC